MGRLWLAVVVGLSLWSVVINPPMSNAGPQDGDGGPGNEQPDPSKP